MKRKNGIELADDDTESDITLLRLRAPSLFLGLVLGVFISFATSRFEEVLTQNIQIAFFLPFIVYMAAAVGSQTQAIYSRDLRSGHAKFHNYLIKESVLGVILGVIFGAVCSVVVWYWFSSNSLAISIGLSMLTTTAVAPVVSLFVTELLQLAKLDPAAGGGPIATVIQDTISVIVYGLICTAILL